MVAFVVSDVLNQAWMAISGLYLMRRMAMMLRA
jgi:hypothetical protein